MTVTAQEARKTGAVAAGSLDAERVDAPQRRRPRLELAVAAAVNTDREITQTGAQVIDRDRDMDVFVSVDPDDDLLDGSCGTLGIADTSKRCLACRLVGRATGL